MDDARRWPEQLDSIVEEFSSCFDSMERYELLFQYAKRNPSFAGRRVDDGNKYMVANHVHMSLATLTTRAIRPEGGRCTDCAGPDCGNCDCRERNESFLCAQCLQNSRFDGHKVIPNAKQSKRFSEYVQEGPREASRYRGGLRLVTESEVMDSLSNVEDPELNLKVTDLGLIYSVEISSNHVEVEMTLLVRVAPSPRVDGGGA